MEGTIMKTMKRVLCFVMAIAMVTAVIPSRAEAAAKVKLNKKKITLKITDKKKNPTKTLKVTAKKGVSLKDLMKAKWTTSNKSVATVKKGKITAKSAGKATITCKVKGKKHKCKVTVIDKRTTSPALNAEVTIRKASDIEYHYTVTQCYNPGDNIYWSAEADLFNPRDSSGNIISVNYGSSLNKITVKYNGEDITGKVGFEIEDPSLSPHFQPSVRKDGTIRLVRRVHDLRLTITYKGMKKTLKLKTEVIKWTDYICYCGYTVKSADELNQHKDTIVSQYGSYTTPDGLDHSGYWYGEVGFVDVVYQ